jgi:hypothetical protein
MNAVEELKRVASAVEHRLTALETEISGVKKWLMGIFASIIVAVIGLILHHVLSTPVQAAKAALTVLRWIL